MNPVVNQGLASSDLSLWSLFWNAHWIVQVVMAGLVICSVWVWAIAIDKTLLYARMRRAMDKFEQAFWSGQSLEELYKIAVVEADALDGRAVRGRHAGMEAQPRRSGALVRGPADAHREGHGCHHRARGRAPGAPAAGARDGGFRRPLHRSVWNRLGHHDELPVDRRQGQHVARRWWPRASPRPCSRPQ